MPLGAVGPGEGVAPWSLFRSRRGSIDSIQAIASPPPTPAVYQMQTAPLTTYVETTVLGRDGEVDIVLTHDNILQRQTVPMQPPCAMFIDPVTKNVVAVPVAIDPSWQFIKFIKSLG